MAVDIQFETSDVVHVLMVDFCFLHFVVQDFVFEGLEDFVADVQVYVEFLDFWEVVLMA